MGDLGIRLVCIDKGVYQAFLVNNEYPCDFVELFVAVSHREGGRWWSYLGRWWILSPVKPGDKVHIGDMHPSSKDVKTKIYIDAKIRKPTRIVDCFEATVPPASKLKKAIGSEYWIDLKPRADKRGIKKSIKDIRLNMKDRYEYVKQRYQQEIDGMSPDERLESLITDQRADNSLVRELEQFKALEEAAADGVDPKTIKDARHQSYLEWYIEDFGLPK